MHESTYPLSSEAILTLLNQGKTTFDSRFMDWRYKNRPGGLVTICLAHDAHGQTVGCRSIFPYIVRVDGREHTFGFQGDLIVDPRHRRMGIGGELVRHCLEGALQKGVNTIVGMPNTISREIQRKTGFRHIGFIQGYRRYFRLDHRLGKLLRPSVLIKILSAVGDVAANFMVPEDRLQLDSEYQLSCDAQIDDEFDVLWNDVSKEVRLVGDRSRQYLTWRYLNHPYKEYKVLKLRRGSRLVGYMIFRTKEHNRIYVDDIFCHADKAVRENLIARGLAWLKTIGAVEVEIGLSDKNALTPYLRRFRFVRCPDRWPFMVFTEKSSSTLLYDISNWHLTFGDKDL